MSELLTRKTKRFDTQVTDFNLAFKQLIKIASDKELHDIQIAVISYQEIHRSSLVSEWLGLLNEEILQRNYSMFNLHPERVTELGHLRECLIACLGINAEDNAD
jgi:hypothetical protein